MKVNLKSNIPDITPTVTAVKLSDINVGDACQIALGYKIGDKITQAQFKDLDKSYCKAIVFQKEVVHGQIKVVLINNLTNRIDNLTTFDTNTPVIPLDCEINFEVNYNLGIQLDNKP